MRKLLMKLYTQVVEDRQHQYLSPCRMFDEQVQRLTNTLVQKDAQIAELQRQLSLKPLLPPNNI